MDPNPPRQTPVTYDIVASAADIIGTKEVGEEEIKAKLLALAKDDMLAKRLREWIPEAFGRLVCSKVHFVDEFIVFTSDRKSVKVPSRAEPILEMATRLAREFSNTGRMELFHRIANLSAPVATAANAAAQGVSLDGAVSASAFNGIPAEAYPDYPKSFWKRLFGN